MREQSWQKKNKGQTGEREISGLVECKVEEELWVQGEREKEREKKEKK